MRVTLPILPRLLNAAAAATLTTPRLPDDLLGGLNSLWSRREPRGVVDAVARDTADAATIWLRTPAGWPAHASGQDVPVGVDADGVRHWRRHSSTSLPNRSDGRVASPSRRSRAGSPPTGSCAGFAAFASRRPRASSRCPTGFVSGLWFVTAGSGITPVAGMLRDLVAPPCAERLLGRGRFRRERAVNRRRR
jgi:hypothetical protein